jgi:hypothetical protein
MWRTVSNVPFAADMKKLGIAYWKMDAESFGISQAVPWDRKDCGLKLNAIRDIVDTLMPILSLFQIICQDSKRCV